jgi:hypothetical protein
MDASTDFLLDLALRGGPVGVVLAVVILGVGFFARGSIRAKMGGVNRAVDENSPDAEILYRLDDIQKRVAEVEHELEDRPTREDYHGLKLGMTQLGGRIDVQQESIKTIKASVLRIEDFLLNYDNGKA